MTNCEVDQPQRYWVNGELSGHPLDKNHPPAAPLTAEQSKAMVRNPNPPDGWVPTCACSWNA